MSEIYDIVMRQLDKLEKDKYRKFKCLVCGKEFDDEYFALACCDDEC